MALDTSAGALILERLGAESAPLVPDAFDADAYAGIRQMYRRQRIGRADVLAAVSYVHTFPAERVAVRPLLTAAVTLVDEVGAHDVFYILLAMQRGCALVTCDRGQAQAATDLGVRAVYIPPA